MFCCSIGGEMNDYTVDEDHERQSLPHSFTKGEKIDTALQKLFFR